MMHCFYFHLELLEKHQVHFCVYVDVCLPCYTALSALIFFCLLRMEEFFFFNIMLNQILSPFYIGCFSGMQTSNSLNEPNLVYEKKFFQPCRANSTSALSLQISLSKPKEKLPFHHGLMSDWDYLTINGKFIENTGSSLVYGYRIYPFSHNSHCSPDTFPLISLETKAAQSWYIV